VSSARLLLVTVVVLALVGLTSWWSGGPSGQEPFEVDAVPTAGRDGAASSTWYCPGGSVLGDEAATHAVLLMNPGGEPVAARLTAVDQEGRTVERTVEVPSPGPLSVNVNRDLELPDASVLVESPAGELVVEHRLTTAAGTDQVPCATTASTEWYFPSQSTLSGDRAQLVLFNPFPVDAGVDLGVATDDSVLVPGAWQGIVVPARSVRVVDLGDESEAEGAFGVQRRGQFALSVRTRTGRVVAETVQTLRNGDTSGLRLQMGVAAPSSVWAMAAGAVDAGAAERLVVYNPGDDTASVAVQVTPHGAVEQPPEPFEFDVAARRYRVVDLNAETRIPTVGFHSVLVETSPSTPVVVGRVLTLTDGPEVASSAEVPGRPELGSGTSIGTGSPVASPLWLVTGARAGEVASTTVLVQNPGTSPVVVSAVVIGGDADATVVADELAVAAGDAVAVPVPAEAGDAPFAVLVEAGGPVVVERLIAFGQPADLVMGLAVPLRPGGAVPLRLDEVR
jgi:hypothetical protein